MATSPRTGVRVVFENAQLGRVVGAHLMAVIAEYAAVVGVLVYAFERSGARATGLASLAILTPTLLGAPIAAVLTNNLRAQMVRQAGLGVQAAGYAAAAAAAAAGLPVGFVVIAAVVALGAVGTLRPTGAVLLPAVVRSSSELAVSNLWISYCECVSALAGPLAAAGLLAIGGPEAVLAVCAGLTVVAFGVSTVGADPGPPPGGDLRTWRLGPVLAGATDTVRARPWTAGVLGVAGARYAILGALDVLLVVLAFEALDVGSTGAGMLNALVGVGALVSAFVATFVARRARLAPWLAAALLVSAVLCVALGVSTSMPVAVVVLPVLGLGGALIDSLGRMLLQRSAAPAVLASMFALVEFVGGIGLLVGSGLAQLLIAVADVEVALYGLAAFLGIMLLATARSVWRADDGADLPVVEMSLLRELPMFAPLSAVALESVARSAVPVPVATGEVVIAQGAPGQHFYAVADGEFEVVQSGRSVRVARRGSYFGEVALLADVNRTADVTALTDGRLLEVDRVPFLVAVTGSDVSHAAAWGVVRSLDLEVDLPREMPPASRAGPSEPSPPGAT